MKSEKSKGDLKHLKFHQLPEDKIIFWDTSFVISALFPPSPERIKTLKSGKRLNDEEREELCRLEFDKHKHDVSIDFIERLIEENINIAFSSILFQEAYFAIQYIVLDEVYKDRGKTKEELKKDPSILSNHISSIMKNWNLFMALLSKFKSRIFPITPSDSLIIKKTLDIRVKYKLEPNDSLHIGTVLAGRIGKENDIVSFDSHFRDVALLEGLNVWWRV